MHAAAGKVPGTPGQMWVAGVKYTSPVSIFVPEISRALVQASPGNTWEPACPGHGFARAPRIVILCVPSLEYDIF